MKTVSNTTLTQSFHYCCAKKMRKQNLWAPRDFLSQTTSLSLLVLVLYTVQVVESSHHPWGSKTNNYSTKNIVNPPSRSSLFSLSRTIPIPKTRKESFLSIRGGDESGDTWIPFRTRKGNHSGTSNPNQKTTTTTKTNQKEKLKDTKPTESGSKHPTKQQSRDKQVPQQSSVSQQHSVVISEQIKAEETTMSGLETLSAASLSFIGLAGSFLLFYPNMMVNDSGSFKTVVASNFGMGACILFLMGGISGLQFQIGRGWKFLLAGTISQLILFAIIR